MHSADNEAREFAKLAACLRFSAIDETTLGMADGLSSKDRGVRKIRVAQDLGKRGCCVLCILLNQVDAMVDAICKPEVQGFHRR